MSSIVTRVCDGCGTFLPTRPSREVHPKAVQEAIYGRTLPSGGELCINCQKVVDILVFNQHIKLVEKENDDDQLRKNSLPGESVTNQTGT